MRIKTNTLKDATLNWAVCRAQYPNADMSATHVWLDSFDGEEDFLIEETSTDWSQAGPIIEREKIDVMPTFGNQWHSTDVSGHVTRFGPTPLIAAMRCYVASKLGDEVQVPAEIIL